MKLLLIGLIFILCHAFPALSRTFRYEIPHVEQVLDNDVVAEYRPFRFAKKTHVLIFGESVVIDKPLRTSGGDALIFADKLEFTDGAFIDTRTRIGHPSPYSRKNTRSSFGCGSVPMLTGSRRFIRPFNDYYYRYSEVDPTSNEGPMLPRGQSPGVCHGAAQNGFDAPRNGIRWDAARSGSIFIIAREIKVPRSKEDPFEALVRSANFDSVLNVIAREPVRAHLPEFTEPKILTVQGMRGGIGGLGSYGDDAVCGPSWEMERNGRVYQPCDAAVLRVRGGLSGRSYRGSAGGAIRVDWLPPSPRGPITDDSTLLQRISLTGFGSTNPYRVRTPTGNTLASNPTMKAFPIEGEPEPPDLQALIEHLLTGSSITETNFPGNNYVAAIRFIEQALKYRFTQTINDRAHVESVKNDRVQPASIDAGSVDYYFEKVDDYLTYVLINVLHAKQMCLLRGITGQQINNCDPYEKLGFVGEPDLSMLGKIPLELQQLLKDHADLPREYSLKAFLNHSANRTGLLAISNTDPAKTIDALMKRIDLNRLRTTLNEVATSLTDLKEIGIWSLELREIPLLQDKLKELEDLQRKATAASSSNPVKQLASFAGIAKRSVEAYYSSNVEGLLRAGADLHQLITDHPEPLRDYQPLIEELKHKLEDVRDQIDRRKVEIRTSKAKALIELAKLTRDSQRNFEQAYRTFPDVLKRMLLDAARLSSSAALEPGYVTVRNAWAELASQALSADIYDSSLAGCGAGPFDFNLWLKEDRGAVHCLAFNWHERDRYIFLKAHPISNQRVLLLKVPARTPIAARSTYLAFWANQIVVLESP